MENNDFGPYVIDIDKPPIGPPSTTMQGLFHGEVETEASKRLSQQYKNYIQEYRRRIQALQRREENEHG